MPTNFPTSIDSFTNPTSGNPVTSPSHSSQHANANDSIAALEAKVGANSSAVTSSHDYKLSGVTGTDKAVSKTGVEAVTNKTITDSTNNVAANSLKSATTNVDTAAATAPSVGQALVATSASAATWQSLLPAGVVVPYVAAAAPTGWLLCDGTSYLRADYPTLFTAIGTTYGSVDGTHFTVPNLKGKTPYGYDSADTNFDTLNTPSVYPGSKTHTLTAAQIPNPGITVPRAGNNVAGSGTFFVMSTTDGGENKATTASLTGAGGTSHNNMPPYAVFTFIIKT